MPPEQRVAGAAVAQLDDLWALLVEMLTEHQQTQLGPATLHVCASVEPHRAAVPQPKPFGKGVVPGVDGEVLSRNTALQVHKRCLEFTE